MDSGESIPKEPISNGPGSDNSPILQIIDFDLIRDTNKFLPVFWQAWLFIFGEDRSAMQRITIAGEERQATEIEGLLYWYLFDQSSKIRIALYDNEIVGFVIYNEVLETVLAIRILYALPGLVGTKTGYRLIDSLPGIKTVIFQTVREIEPEQMFSITRGRQVKLNETPEMITWAMNWEK